jgi:hypothetical protein
MTPAGSIGPGRRCPICGTSLEGHRRDAVTCSGRCRAERSRLLRILGGTAADGSLTLPDTGWERRKRTDRAGAGRPSKPVADRLGSE